MDEDFVAALRRTDARWDAQVPPALDARVVRALERRRLPTRLPVYAGAAAIAAAAIAFVVMTRAPSEDAPAEAPWSLQFTPPSCAPAVLAATIELPAGCRLDVSGVGLVIEAVEPMRLRRSPLHVQLEAGAGRMVVTPAAHRAEPLVLVTSGGRLEVDAAALDVRLDQQRLSVEEGVARWQASSGEVVFVRGGEAASWATQSPKRSPSAAASAPAERAPTRRASTPRAAAASEPSADAASRPRDDAPPSTWSSEQTEAAVRWVAQLRAEGRFQEAVDWIARLLDAPLDARAAEVLSFERGQLLALKLSQPSRACAHWRTHQVRFEGGRYRREVAEALARCQETSASPEHE